MKCLEHNTARDVLRAGDGCLSGCLLALIAIVATLVFLNTGCSTCPRSSSEISESYASTCPPCQPTDRIVEVKVPVYSCPEVPDIGQVSLPPYPQLHPDATDEQLKEFYASLAHTVRSRDSIQSNYIQYLLSLLEPYRAP